MYTGARLFAISVMVAVMLAAAVPVGAADGIVSFRVYEPYPQQYSNETVGVRLRYADTSPATNVAVHSVWNYRTTTAEADASIDNTGYAYLQRNIGDATCGFTVRVDIFIWWDSAWSQVDSQFFTPCYDADAHARDIVDHMSDAVYGPGPIPDLTSPVAGRGVTCPADHPIKGNDNSGIYHVPGGQFYDATNARKCFTSEGAAILAGYRKSER